MIYLSQLVGKAICYKGNTIGKVLDIAVMENRPTPPISKIVIKRDNRRLTMPTSSMGIEDNRLILKTAETPFLPYDKNAFYLAEDLLDKQVIDIHGKRVVRVNDVVLENNGELKVIGIDVGFSAVLKRLGIRNLFNLKPKILPWTLIETFDYSTGAIRIKLNENKLHSFHPSELADILEDLGTKERLSLVEFLDAQKAASAIQEADNKTQLSILEQLSPFRLRNIINKMLVSEIADIFYKLTPLRIKEILHLLGPEKAQKVRKLVAFSDDVAGGIMKTSYYQMDSEKTVKETLETLKREGVKPEAIIVVGPENKLVGTLLLKNLVNTEKLALLKDIVTDKKFVYDNTHFSQILRLFAKYNLRVLPVVNDEKKASGIITIDGILAKIEEGEEKNDVL
ncbi:CBS domain-containing protein [Patescibacteria group bacterium]|nr:CBS domain-containing protein [Patescibacteria group bacterium]